MTSILVQMMPWLPLAAILGLSLIWLDRRVRESPPRNPDAPGSAGLRVPTPSPIILGAVALLILAVGVVLTQIGVLR